MFSDQPPTTSATFPGSATPPLVLGGILALLAVGTLRPTCSVTAVRRRRRDLAMLKTLGLVRRQVLERGRNGRRSAWPRSPC